MPMSQASACCVCGVAFCVIAAVRFVRGSHSRRPKQDPVFLLADSVGKAMPLLHGACMQLPMHAGVHVSMQVVVGLPGESGPALLCASVVSSCCLAGGVLWVVTC